MRPIPSLKGEITPVFYAIAAPTLIFLQNVVVILAFQLADSRLVFDAEFWLLPLRRFALLPDLPSWAAALALVFSLCVAWGLALLSFRRASRSGMGYAVAALTIVPAIQVLAVAVLIFMPTSSLDREPEPEAGVEAAHVLQGALAGITIIVLAVLVSAMTFGAYGWGLFVATPFLLGVTTAFLANRRVPLHPGRTLPLVMAAAALGSLALVMLALEGIVCIAMAAPLGALAAAAGGALGRAAALSAHERGKPLKSLALLPAVFAMEAAMPPSVPIAMHETIDVAAPPAAVWRALTSSEPIASSPGFVARAGLERDDSTPKRILS